MPKETVISTRDLGRKDKLREIMISMWSEDEVTSFICKLSLTSKSTSPSSSSNDLIDRQILLFQRQSLKIHHSLML